MKTIEGSNVLELPPSAPAPPGAGGGGNNYGERLSALEERTRHLATSAEVKEVRIEIEQVRVEVARASTVIDNVKGDMTEIKGEMKWITRWLIGASITLLSAVVSGIVFFMVRGTLG